MIRNYVKIALRNLRRNVGYTFINIVGLAVGIACCVLITLYIRDELAFDRKHPEVGRLYRLTNAVTTSEDVMPMAITPAIYSKTFHETFPEVEQFARFHPVPIGLMLSYGDQRFYENDGVFADSSFFELFHFPLRAGDAPTALKEPFSVVISPDIARKYFGEADPIGQKLRMNEEYDLTVTGVLRENPSQTHLDFSMLLSYKTIESLNGVWYYGATGLFLRSWHLAAGYSYVRLAAGADVAEMESRLNEMVKSHIADDGPKYALTLTPVADLHLKSHFLYEMRAGGSLQNIWVFGIISLFILAIACVNYMNLATARAIRRAVEVGLRKVIGANRGQLIRQFLSESMVTAFIVLLFALVIVAACLPLFNSLTDKTLSYGTLFDPVIMAGFVGVTLLTGFVAGLYPAFFLSSYQPSHILKGESRSGTGSHARFRKLLVVFQFTATIVLIAGALTVQQQLRYFQSKDMGYDREQLLTVPMRDASIVRQAEVIKKRLMANPAVLQVSATSTVPGSGASRHDTKPGGRAPDERWLMAFYGVDFDFVETMGFEIVAGRNFSPDFQTDSTQAYLLNEAAVERLGWTGDAVGRDFAWINPRRGLLQGKVVGVVRDFHYEPLSRPIEPTFFALAPDWAQALTIRIRPEGIPETMASIESVWKELVPAFPFEYLFQDERLNNAYQSEERFGRIAGVFAALAIFIACLGLVGLAAYSAEQRKKEIGIRKVFGASVTEILRLLSKDYLVLVIVSFVLAVPLAWYGMSRWLEDFAYRIELGPGVFVTAGLAALLIALATVSFQSAKTAMTNPVKSLRNE